MNRVKLVGLASGLFASLFILLFIDLDPGNNDITVMAAISVLMAILWISEAIPLAATSLIPLVLYPVFGILKSDQIASSYINSVIFLFLGGFMIALAMERWNLHKRIALKIISVFGGSPQSIVFGFMLAGAFLSMWISNTATAIMMIPIAIAVITGIENQFDESISHKFSLAVLLGIAYSCTIGGMATIVGTPPNLVFVETMRIMFPAAPEISFSKWMFIAFPISIAMLLCTAVILTKVLIRFDRSLKINRSFIEEEYKQLGRISYEEKIVSIVFALTAILWIFRNELNFGFFQIPGWSEIFNHSGFISDGTVAISMALILFLIPAKKEKTTLLDKDIFSKIPWGIILLFGGGFALAKGFTTTGLSDYIGSHISGLSTFPQILMIFFVALSISFLTELTSNTATTQMILPVLASVSVAIGMNPILLMITATLSASMAFMLPVATPPNTIIFASNRIKIYEMSRTGFVLNFVGVIIVTVLVYFLGISLFDLGIFPNWAIPK